MTPSNSQQLGDDGNWYDYGSEEFFAAQAAHRAATEYDKKVHADDTADTVAEYLKSIGEETGFQPMTDEEYAKFLYTKMLNGADPLGKRTDSRQYY